MLHENNAPENSRKIVLRSMQGLPPPRLQHAPQHAQLRASDHAANHAGKNAPCDKGLTDAAGCVVMVGCCQHGHGLQLLSVMFRMTFANKIQRS